MTTTFKQTYSKVMEELINEKKEYYKYLKNNNHLSWCKGKIRRRWIIFIRRKYTMPLYMKQNKEVKKVEEPNRGGKADLNYEVIATLQRYGRQFTYSFSNRMTSTCYKIQKRSPYNTHFTISQKWWDRANDEDLEKFNRKIISTYTNL
jgi:hypothetical protein